MMLTSHNCIVCAEEFNAEDLHNIKLSEINVTRFKICEKCLNLSNPENDYQEVKSIVGSYLNINENRVPPARAAEILNILNSNLSNLKDND